MTRAEALQALVRFSQRLDSVAAAIGEFPYDWDDEEPLAILTRGDVLAVLTRWQTGELTERDVEKWANHVEMRDDSITTLLTPLLLTLYTNWQIRRWKDPFNWLIRS